MMDTPSSGRNLWFADCTGHGPINWEAPGPLQIRHNNPTGDIITWSGHWGLVVNVYRHWTLIVVFV